MVGEKIVYSLISGLCLDSLDCINGLLPVPSSNDQTCAKACQSAHSDPADPRRSSGDKEDSTIHATWV
jgi:hypothetical protein